MPMETDQMPMETDIPKTVTGGNTCTCTCEVFALVFTFIGIVLGIIACLVGGALCRNRILSWLEKRNEGAERSADEDAAELQSLTSHHSEISTRSAVASESETNISDHTPNQPAKITTGKTSEEVNGSTVLDQSSPNHQAGAPDVRDGADVAGGSDNASAACLGNTVQPEICMDLEKLSAYELEEFMNKYRRELVQQETPIKSDKEMEEELCNGLTKYGRDDLSNRVKSHAEFGS